jgi:flagellar protein FliO/FliZ
MPFLQALAGLALVLAVIGAFAWLARRVQRIAPARGSPLALRGALAVGPRERVVVLEIEGTWLVLGVAPGRVSALHALPKGTIPETSPQSLIDKWTSSR